MKTATTTMTLDILASFYKAAGDPLRLNVLQALGNNSFAASELSTLLALSQSRLSHHLKVLSNAGLVETRREGNTLFYRRRLPDWEQDPELATTQQALFNAVNSLPKSEQLIAAMQQIEEQRSAQSQAYFAQQGSQISNDPFLTYSQDYQDLAAKILQRALPNGGESGLEIGPGEGGFLLRIAPLFKRLVAIEASGNMLERAAQNLTQAHVKHAKLVQGYWPHNAPAEQFDAVVINMVLHHVAHPADSITAAARRLKPNGVLLITELCQHEQDWVKERCGHVWQGFSEDDLLRWGAESGLALQENQYLALRNGFQLQVISFVQHT